MIITFHGSDHKAGTSMISLSLAEYLAKNKDLNILLIHAEGNRGNTFGPYTAESMERIRPYLYDKLIDSSEIAEKSRVSENLSIIGGTEKLGSIGDYHPDIMQFFLDNIKHSYDYIICDSGAEPDCGISLGALFAADKVCLVFKPIESSIMRYEWLKNIYERLGIAFSAYVINEYERGKKYSVKYVEERLNLGADQLLTIRKSSYSRDAELERCSIFELKDSGFSKDIKRLAEFLTNE